MLHIVPDVVKGDRGILILFGFQARYLSGALDFLEIADAGLFCEAVRARTVAGSAMAANSPMSATTIMISVMVNPGGAE